MLGLAAVKNSSTPSVKRRDGPKKTQAMLNLSLNRGDATAPQPTRSLFRARSMVNVTEETDGERTKKHRSTNIAPFLQQSEDEPEAEVCKTSVEQTPVLTVIDFKKHMRFATKAAPEAYEFDPAPMMQAKGSL